MASNLSAEIRNKMSILQVATATAMLGTVIDRKGFNGVEILTTFGGFGAATESITLTLLECDNSTTGNFTSVADTYLIGTEAGASIVAATRVDGSTKNVGKHVGYTGNKRYIRPVLTAVGTTTTVVAVNVLLHTPEAATVAIP